MSKIDNIANKVMMRFAKEKVDVPPDFQGNPEVHGIDEPRSGGFSIMENLQKDLVKQQKKDMKAMSSRVAMYWYDRDRTYRLTKSEQGPEGTVTCPKCKDDMVSKKFTRSEKMYCCENCGFMIPTSKVVTKKIEIEIEPDGEVEVEVTEASFGHKSRRKNHGF